MYAEYYGLVRQPFEMSPDPSFLYLGRRIAKAWPRSSTQ